MKAYREQPTHSVGGAEFTLSLVPFGHVLDELRTLERRYWLAVEREVDHMLAGNKTQLRFVAGISTPPKDTQVTRPSMHEFALRECGDNVSEWEAPTAHMAERSSTSALRLGRKDRATARMLALAAREVASRGPKYSKADQTPNQLSVANLWLHHLRETEDDSDLSADNISRHISEGLKEL
ncbi:MAG: hypothetical protein RKE50_03360 [Pseudohaliea sp.]